MSVTLEPLQHTPTRTAPDPRYGEPNSDPRAAAPSVGGPRDVRRRGTRAGPAHARTAYPSPTGSAPAVPQRAPATARRTPRGRPRLRTQRCRARAFRASRGRCLSRAAGSATRRSPEEFGWQTVSTVPRVCTSRPPRRLWSSNHSTLAHFEGSRSQTRRRGGSGGPSRLGVYGVESGAMTWTSQREVS